MAKKLTKRKAFNFLRSYFDVLNELESSEDKLNYLLSIIDKQFLDEDPKNLNFITNLCYESQRHSVEKSVKGWKTANKTDLLGNPILPKGSPLPLPLPLPLQEVQEEEKEKEEIIYITESYFLKRWKDARMHYDKKPTNISKLTPYERANFEELKKDYNLKQFEQAVQGFFKQKTFLKTRLRPTHFLNREHFETYLTCFETKEVLFPSKVTKKPIDRI